MTAAAGVLADADGVGAPSAEELLARALEVIERQSAEIRELREQNTRLRELVARQAEELAGKSSQIL